MRAPGLLAFFLVHCFAAASASVPLAFHLTPQGAIIVPVAVNGVGPTLFLLDTGSNGSVISDELASARGAPVVARTTMVSASGRKEVLVARIEHLALGEVTASGVLATLASPDSLNLPDLALSGHKVQGVIGQDVLASLRYTIDYRKRTIVWHDAGAALAQRGTALELQRQDDRFLVLLPQAHRVLRLVPDSGADTLVLFEEDGASHGSAGPAEPAGLTSLTGTLAVRRTIVRALRVGSTTLVDVAAVVVGRETGSPSADGLLPLHLFARVTFDGPEGQLFIEGH